MRATGVGRSLGHTTLCGASFRATSLGTKVHAGPPSDPGWVASTTLPQCSLTDRTPVPPLPSPGPCRKAEAADHTPAPPPQPRTVQEGRGSSSSGVY